jgi:hypothetical protein
MYSKPHMITFSVVGTFKEGKKEDKVRPIRSFERVFVCIPDANTAYVFAFISCTPRTKYHTSGSFFYRMSIINEQFVIANVTNQHYKVGQVDKNRTNVWDQKLRFHETGLQINKTILFLIRTTTRRKNELSSLQLTKNQTQIHNRNSIRLKIYCLWIWTKYRNSKSNGFRWNPNWTLNGLTSKNNSIHFSHRIPREASR